MNRYPLLTLAELCGEAGLPLPMSRAEVPVAGISTDSRTLRAGEIFVAIPGLSTDARCHISEAIRRGALAIVTEPPAPDLPTEGNACPMVVVPSARVAAACLYDAWYDHPGRRLCLVGVTGTNGKTSVAAMLRHILRSAGVPCGLIGTVGCIPPDEDTPITSLHDTGELPAGMTTPDPAYLYALLDRMAGRDPAVRPTVVMEVTSHALALSKVAPLDFDTAIFTNLTPEHMDLHGSMEDYFAAKRRLFAVARRAVINADDRYGRMLLSEPLPIHHWYICHAAGMAAVSADRMCPSGEGSCTRVYAEQVKHRGEEGVIFKLTSPDVRVRLACPVPGEFSLANALEAATAALALGVSPADVRDALATFPGVPGRMERLRFPESRFPGVVFIDFAHTPDALEKLLGTVHGFCRRDRRIVLLFGCGGDRDRSKRKVMARIASRMADSLIITSDNSRSEDPAAIISDILAGVDKESEFTVIPDRREAIREAIRSARAGDIILLCGKGHENYEITADGPHPFSERGIAAEAVKEFWT